MPPADPIPAFACSRTWESLKPTRRPGVRHCEACHQDVHLTHEAEGVWRLARKGHCVAYAPTKTMGMFLSNQVDTPVVARLVAVAGPAVGTTFQLGASAVIGSAPPAEIVIADPTLALAHCRLARGAYDFTLVAIEAADVFVNGVRVERFELVDGDRIALGASQLVFKSTA
ncbi:MAG: FHA domain-containing protein [Myxococcales bacterium]|nr:FHA domain-containing protein [Myxococcales bacterium]